MSEKDLRVENETSAKIEELSTDIENISSQEEFTRAVKLFNEGQLIEAIEIFGHYSRMGSSLARQYLARSYHRLEQHEVAYKHFQFLAEHGEGDYRDYGASMMAAIEIVWGNYSKAVKVLKSLTPNPRNQINLAILYWKKYKVQKEEFSIREAMRILNKLDVDSLSQAVRRVILHLKALIHQAQKDYKLAESFYQQACNIANDNIGRAQIMNDFGSLYIELKDYDNAKDILLQARQLVLGCCELEEAFNDKWLGILAIKRRDYKVAKEHLTKAVKVIREKDLLREVAGIVFLLAEFSREEGFYKAADYYADGIALERLLEEVKESDEKIVHFYFDMFFGSAGNTSSSS